MPDSADVMPDFYMCTVSWLYFNQIPIFFLKKTKNPIYLVTFAISMFRNCLKQFFTIVMCSISAE